MTLTGIWPSLDPHVVRGGIAHWISTLTSAYQILHAVKHLAP